MGTEASVLLSGIIAWWIGALRTLAAALSVVVGRPEVIPEAIVLLPGIIAWWIAARRSLAAALIGVYVPVLLLIPDYFRMPIDSFPDLGFGQATILPIGIGVVWLALFRREWRLSTLDFFLCAFVVWQFTSDVYNLGYQDALNLLFDLVTLTVFPYMAGKALIEPAGMRALFARRFVWLLFIVCILSVYEFRMGTNVFRPLIAPFFPLQESGWFTQIRLGFARIAGPYGHAILMSALLTVGYLLCRWLALAGLWEKKFKGIGSFLPFTKAQIMTLGLIGGMIMTLSRGPWVGAGCGVVLAAMGTSTNRRRGLKRAILLLVGGGVLLYAAGIQYIRDIAPKGVLEEQSSAAYRAALLEQYNSIAMERPLWGWGRGNWPIVPGMKSIDNHYLLLALGSGLVGTALFALMLVVASCRLFASGFFIENMEPADRAFRFTMLGVLVATAITLGTVFLGSQLYPLLFLFLGWSEAVIVFQPEPEEVLFSEEPAASFGPMRVIA